MDVLKNQCLRSATGRLRQADLAVLVMLRASIGTQITADPPMLSLLNKLNTLCKHKSPLIPSQAQATHHQNGMTASSEKPCGTIQSSCLLYR